MTPEALTPSLSCCDVWPCLLGAFDWFRPDPDTEVRVMPCVADYRVNYCPSCGAPRRDVVESLARIEAARLAVPP